MLSPEPCGQGSRACQQNPFICAHSSVDMTAPRGKLLQGPALQQREREVLSAWVPAGVPSSESCQGSERWPDPLCPNKPFLGRVVYK